MSHSESSGAPPPALRCLPPQWELTRLRYLSSIRYGLGQPPREMADGLPLIRATNVKRGRIVRDNLVFVDPSDIPSGRDAILREGDIVVVRSGAYTGDSALVTSEFDGAVTGYDMVVRPTQADSRFLAYTLLSSPVLNDQIDLCRLRAAQPHLNAKELGDTWVAVPPRAEQRAIADHLDEKTAAIDALIARRERHIALLEEKRRAIVVGRTLRGIDPGVSVQDSGTRWMGEIPAHWRVARIKHVARLESGHTPDRKIDEYWADGTIPWVSLKDTKTLASTDYISDTAECTTPAGLANSSARVLPAGTVVFTRDATIGLAAIATRSMAVSQHLIGWVCGKELLPEYLLRVIDAMRDELDRLTFGATIKTIGMDDVKELTTPLPPVDEQRAIVDAIRTELERHDALIARIQAQIEKLREYRQTLISAAATGQIPAREEVPA